MRCRAQRSLIARHGSSLFECDSAQVGGWLAPIVLLLRCPLFPYP